MNAELAVKRTIEEHKLISEGDKVLLGLSGGSDSLCLLHILMWLKDSMGFELYALHLNHKIRGEAADLDAAWVEEHCGNLGIPLSLRVCDIPAYAKKKGISEEQAGREIRYRELAAEAERLGGAKIALAHNMNDQAETVLLRILRGTGVHGLAAMEYMRDDGVIRPLLDTSRGDIECYCERHSLEPRIDETNLEIEYIRSRVRNLLIPLLEEEFNPNISMALTRLAASAREDDSCLEDLATVWFSSRKSPDSSFALSDMQELPKAIFARVVISAFSELGLEEDIAAVHINALKSAVDKGHGGKTIEFPGGYEASIVRGRVSFGRNPEKFVKS